MSVRLNDLPLAVRQQLEKDGLVPAKRERLSKAGTGLSVPCRGTCGRCGESFPTAAKGLAHIKSVHDGNGRWAIDLTADEGEK